MYEKHGSISFITLLIMPRLSEMNDLAQLECYRLGCVFLTSHDIKIAIRQFYSASEIVTRLLGQLKIEAGLVNQERRSDVRWKLTPIVSTIFALAISVPIGYRQCQTNSRAPRILCFRFFIKKYFIVMSLNHVQFLDKF